MTNTAITQTVTTEFIEVDLEESLLTDEEEKFLLDLERGVDIESEDDLERKAPRTS